MTEDSGADKMHPDRENTKQTPERPPDASPQPPPPPQSPPPPPTPDKNPLPSVLDNRPPGVKSQAPQLVLWALLILICLAALVFSLWGLASETGLIKLPGYITEMGQSISSLISESGQKKETPPNRKNPAAAPQSPGILARLEKAHAALAENPKNQDATRLVSSLRMEAVQKARRLFLEGKGKAARELLYKASDMSKGFSYSRRIKLINLKGSIKRPEGGAAYLIITGQAHNLGNQALKNICVEIKATAKDKSILARSWALAGPAPEAGKFQSLKPDALSGLLLDSKRGKAVKPLAKQPFTAIIPNPPPKTAGYRVGVFAVE